MRKIKEFVKEYKLEIFFAICLFSNLYPDLPHFLYFALIALFLFYSRKCGAQLSVSRKGCTIGLIGVIVFSFLMSGQFDFRFILMSVLLFLTLGISSYQYYRLKVRFLYVCIMGFAFTSILNYYASVRGINYQLIMGMHAGEAFTYDFSGFTYHPMWLSAATGIGTIFFVHLMVKCWNDVKRKKLLFLILPLAFMSFLVSVKAGSRSAAGISVLSSCLLIYVGSKRVSNTVIILMLLAVVTSFLMPVIMENTMRMQTKHGGLNLRDDKGTTSRTRLWNDRIEEFESSPIWGVGFGVAGIGKDKKVGRIETGSGWLTVLSQTGIIGFILVIFSVKKAILPLSVLKEDDKLTLFSIVLFYFCLHSLFEAYMFQAGWYLCLLFWMLISVLDDSKEYGYPNDVINEEDY